jgi:hypothetical protein
MHNEELHNLYISPTTTRVIKSRRMRWLGHVACLGEIRKAYKILVRKTEGDHMEDLGIKWMLILEWNLWKQGVEIWTGFILLKMENSGRLL